MIMVALVRSWQDLAKILASIPMHLGKRAKIRVTGQTQFFPVFFNGSFEIEQKQNLEHRAPLLIFRHYATYRRDFISAGAFINRRARLLQSLVFLFKTDSNATKILFSLFN